MNFDFVYKICTKSEWSNAKQNNIFKGTTLDLKDGYIHFSDEKQIEGTLKKYYLHKKNLLLLKVDTLKLDHLLWEQASDGNMFPHLYSTLDIKNVVSEYEIILNEDGTHILPNNY